MARETAAARAKRKRAEARASAEPKESATQRAKRKLKELRERGEYVDNFVPNAHTRHVQRARKTRTRTPYEHQNHDDPQPRAHNIQTADELKNPPMRPGKNGGLLRTGGTNKGGSGATPAELRQRVRDALDLDEIFEVPLLVIRDPHATHAEKLSAWDKLCKYGGLASVSLTDGDGNPLELPPFVVQLMDEQKKKPE